MYAIKDTKPASHPCNLCLLSKIRPVAMNNKIMPANDIHIFKSETDNIYHLFIETINDTNEL